MPTVKQCKTYLNDVMPHYKENFKSIWHLRNGKSESAKEVREALRWNLRRIREYTKLLK